jgi:hypothetical protein
MLRNDIGINAGTIWYLLDEKGALSISEIAEYTNFREPFIFYALGWLARESKILFFERGDTMFVQLICRPEIYY